MSAATTAHAVLRASLTIFPFQLLKQRDDMFLSEETAHPNSLNGDLDNIKYDY